MSKRMEVSFDRSKSLQELEDSDWGEPNYPSNLVTSVHRLRRQPLREFTPGDLRLFIGQKLSLGFLIPLALEQLAEDPLVEGTYFPADLLINVAESGNEFLGAHLALLELFVPILERGVGMMASLESYDRDIIEDRLKAALEKHKQTLRDAERN